MNLVAAKRTGRFRLRPLARAGYLGAELIALAVALSGCSYFEDFNPFGAERYKTVIEPDVGVLGRPARDHADHGAPDPRDHPGEIARVLGRDA